MYSHLVKLVLCHASQLLAVVGGDRLSPHAPGVAEGKPAVHKEQIDGQICSLVLPEQGEDEGRGRQGTHRVREGIKGERGIEESENWSENSEI